MHGHEAMGALATTHGPSTAAPSSTRASLQRALLVCGIASSLVYGAMNAFVPYLWPEYDSSWQTVSELSAIDAPTRPVWVGLGFLYTALYGAFGAGVWMEGKGSRALRVAGALVFVSAVLGIFWPPMHLRPVLAAGGGTLSDTLHIVWTAAWGLLSMVAMGFAAAHFRWRFRAFTVLSIGAMLAFGTLTSRDAPNVDLNLPTPWMGVWERVNIGIFYVWVIAFAAALLRAHRRDGAKTGGGLRAQIKLLVGAGDRIMLYTLPFAVLGIVANVLWPAAFHVGTVGIPIGVVLLALGVPMWIGSAVQILVYVPKGKLITTGPFAILIHPLYTSVALLVIPGVGMVFGSWVGFAIGLALYLSSRRFAPAEERDLAAQFPDEYPAYKKRVLLPWL